MWLFQPGPDTAEVEHAVVDAISSKLWREASGAKCGAGLGEGVDLVVLRTPDVVSIPIADALKAPCNVDPKGQLVATARDLGICFGD